MNSIDKAHELVKCYLEVGLIVSDANKCALIDVENTLDVLRGLKATTEILKEYRFWFEVKEIIKRFK